MAVLKIKPDELLTGEKVLYASGSHSMTGATTISTGMKEVICAVACLGEALALTGDGVDVVISNQTTNPGRIVVTPRKRASSSDCTPAAATAAKVVHWIAWGKGPEG